MSAHNIDSALIENRKFEPNADFVARARIRKEEFDALHKLAKEDYTGFWAKQARELLSWHRPFKEVLDDSHAPHFKWFADGALNVSYNCLDRHLASKANKTAIIFEGEKGDVRKISYQQLTDQVSQLRGEPMFVSHVCRRTPTHGPRRQGWRWLYLVPAGREHAQGRSRRR